MASNDINIRFTEEKYDSKTDLIKDLKTSLVDNFWRNILSYRQQYNVKIGLHNFAYTEYVLCNTEMTLAKNVAMENKLAKLLEEVGNVIDEDFPKLEFQSYLYLLKFVAASNGLDNSDVKMRTILRNELKTLDISNIILPRYINVLNYLKKHYTDTIDIDFIHEIHHHLVNDPSSSFRNKEDTNPLNRVLIDRIYTAAPISQIEGMMQEVVIFIQNSELSTLNKAFIVYYALCSIKPYASYSREVALLVSKTIIAQDSMGEVGLLFPLEKLLVVNKEEEEKIFNDVQKYSDTTYFVRYALDYLENIISEYNDRLEIFKNDNVREEYYQVDELEAEPEIVKQEPLVEKKVVEPQKEAPVSKEAVPEIKKEKKVKVVELNEVAIRYVPRGLDEKEAQKLEVQLLEMDPSLKKKEAHFYAHHCTLGMNYTIQHYKKYCRVAYETARTSMDHLAELGYYRKEQIKNKFVYSPIKKN